MNRQLRVKSLQAVLLAAFLFPQGCSQKKEEAAKPPPEVVVVTVQPRRLALTTELPGRTASYLVAEIRPQVSGVVQKRLFTEGSDVKAGDVLYEIDPKPYQAAYDTAVANLGVMRETAGQARAALTVSQAVVVQKKATLELAKINRQRYEDMFKENAVPATQRDTAVTEAVVAEAMVKAAEAQSESDRQAIAVAEASIKQAQTAIETAKINLDYTKITAPISGRIGKSALTTGAMVTAYQAVPLATIQQLDPIYVDVPQATAELLRLKKRMETGQLNRSDLSQKVKIILEDGTEYSAEGTLQYRDVSVDPTTASVILRVVVPNPKSVLLPGMFVRAVVSEGVNEQAILIPQQSVSRDPKGNPKTLVVNADKVEQRMLTLDRAIGDEWLVLKGLNPGDRVIVEGLQKARIGEAVKVVTPAASPERAAEPQEAPQPATAAK